jgi:integrase
MPRYGPGYVKRRGKIWYVYYSHQGTEHGVSSGSVRRSDAEALRAKLIAERDQGLLPTGPPRLTVRQVVEQLLQRLALEQKKSLRHIRAHAKALAWFATTLAAQLTEAHIDRYIIHRQALGRQPATINRELGLLGQALRLAHRRRQLAVVPHIRLLPVSNVRQGFFLSGEVTALCQHLTPPVAAVVQFAFLTGWRRGEILTLEWRDVDWPGGVIRLRPAHSKTNQGRVLPMNQGLQTLLAQQDAVRTLLTPCVFHRSGKPIVRFETQWRRACAAIGKPGMVFHDLRRSAALAMERAGIHERVAMALMGHTTLAMHRRYKIVQEAELREAMARLDTGSVTQQVVPLRRTGGGT